MARVSRAPLVKLSAADHAARVAELKAAVQALKDQGADTWVIQQAVEDLHEAEAAPYDATAADPIDVSKE